MNYQENLKAYLDGELSPADAAALEAALTSDLDLARELEELRSVTAMVRTIPEPVPYGLEQALWRLEKLDAKPVAKPLWGRWLTAGLVGAGAIVLSLTLLFPDQTFSKESATVAMAGSKEPNDLGDIHFNTDAQSSSVVKQAAPSAPSESEKRTKSFVAKPSAGIREPQSELDTRPTPAKESKKVDQPVNLPAPGQREERTRRVSEKPLENGIADANVNSAQSRFKAQAPIVGTPLKAESHLRNIQPVPQTLETREVLETKADLARLVHAFKGTINIGQPKGSPMVATITVPENRMEEFAAAVRGLQRQQQNQAQGDSSVSLRGGGAGSAGGMGGGQGSMGGNRETSQLVAPKASTAKADRGTASKSSFASVKDSKRKVTFQIQIVPTNE